MEKEPPTLVASAVILPSPKRGRPTVAAAASLPRFKQPSTVSAGHGRRNSNAFAGTNALGTAMRGLDTDKEQPVMPFMRPAPDRPISGHLALARRRASAPNGGDSFHQILEEAREKSKAMHNDPFDRHGPVRLFGPPSPGIKPLAFSLNTGDALCGFPRGCRAAYKDSGVLVTVLHAGATQGLLEVQLDPKDVDGEGEVIVAKAEDLFLPKAGELAALELRKNKVVMDDQHPSVHDDQLRTRRGKA